MAKAFITTRSLKANTTGFVRPARRIFASKPNTPTTDTDVDFASNLFLPTFAAIRRSWHDYLARSSPQRIASRYDWATFFESTPISLREFQSASS